MYKYTFEGNIAAERPIPGCHHMVTEGEGSRGWMNAGCSVPMSEKTGGHEVLGRNRGEDMDPTWTHCMGRRP